MESEQHAASYKRFLSTLPARGATRSSHWGPRSSMISIHAPREGSDRDPAELFEGQLRISIHAPREGSDRRRCRGAAGRRDFYPRSPRGERRAARGIWIYLMGDFYPRSPRGERPVHTLDTGLLEDLFLSTLPARGATFSQGRSPPPVRISIHAPREGSDAGRCRGCGRDSHFYPRSPRGERRRPGRAGRSRRYFYPRSPRGERHDGAAEGPAYKVISIHAPREGSDFMPSVRPTSR